MVKTRNINMIRHSKSYKIKYSNKIINDLLDFSREIKLDLSNVNIREFVNQCLSEYEIPDGYEILNLVEDKQIIELDQQKISRIFMNIIDNAFDAMPNGGMFTISSKILPNEIEIFFMDTGTGIPDEILEDIWKPLFTTKPKGMGLGLAICKRMVEAHEGSIEVSSIDGKGTIFTVKLPIDQKETEFFNSSVLLAHFPINQ